MSVIEFSVPLPPVWIRSNSRSHWARRMRAKQEYSEAVYAAACETLSGRVAIALGAAVAPLDKARVTFTWRACRLPDQANVLPNCKALLDILCMAPKTTQPNNTTYLGIIEDDKGVEAIGRVEKVRHRHEECVHIRIERIDEHAYCAQDWHRCADGGGKGEYDRYVGDADAHPR